MQRTEAEVVRKTLAIVAEYERNPDQILDIGVRVASRMFFKPLQSLLALYKDSQVVAVPKKLKSLEDYLRKWKKKLIATPALLCYQPNLLVNKVCIALAEDLATVLPYSALDLLLPNVIIPEGFQTKHYNDFVVTEDGHLIGVLQGLDTVRTDETHRYTHPATGEDMDPDLLSDHSTQAWIYAAKIRNLLRPSEEEEADCDRTRTELEAIIKENMATRRTPAHKEAGQKRLMLALTKKVHSLTELAEFLDAFVLKSEWTEFLRSMEGEELYRIVIPKRGQTPQKKDQLDSDYKVEQAKNALPAMFELAGSVIDWPKNDNAKRALVFMMNFVYSQVRRDAPKYTDKLGGWGGSFSKDDVLAQTKAMQDFLLGEEEMVNLEAYLKKQVDEKKIIPINSPTCLALKHQIINAGRHCEPKQEAKPSEAKQEEKLASVAGLTL